MLLLLIENLMPIYIQIYINKQFIQKCNLLKKTVLIQIKQHKDNNFIRKCMQ